MAINNQQEPGFEMITTVSYNTAGVCAWHGNQQPTGTRLLNDYHCKL